MTTFLPTQINLGEIDPDSGFEPIPPGEYVLIILETDVRSNSKNTGSFLEMKYQVASGPYAGQELRDYINVQHENKKAERIGIQRFAALCRAAGFPENALVQDTAVLLNRQVRAEVDVEATKDPSTGKEYQNNRIKKYCFEQKAAATEQAVQQVAQVASGTSKPAWEN